MISKIISEKKKMNVHFEHADNVSNIEILKVPKRYELINYLLQKTKDKTYLEIGVGDPNQNFNRIIGANTKHCVDPGVEYENHQTDFPIESNEFFKKLSDGLTPFSPSIKWSIIFIDGLHYGYQVQRDIENSLNHLADDGFIVLHDCNPPTEHHAREDYSFKDGPGGGYWNGTTWKAIQYYRTIKQVDTCVIDSDWGLGVICKRTNSNKLSSDANPFYEYHIFDKNRIKFLNLMNYDAFKRWITK